MARTCPSNDDKALLLEQCHHCATHICCKIEPAFLTPQDLERMGLSPQDQEHVNKSAWNGFEFLHLQKRKNGKCVFYDSESKKCSKWNSRPLDCRLFPLDIDFHDGRFYWICYSYCKASVTEYKLQKLEKTLLPEFTPYLAVYALLPMKMFESGSYRILREVQL